MAVGTKVRGIEGQLYNGVVKIAALHDIGFQQVADTFDDSDHDSGSYGSKNTGAINTTITAEGWFLDQDTNQMALAAALALGTELTIKYRPRGTGAGKTEWSVQAVLSKYSVGAPQNGSQPVSYQFEGRGAVVFATQ